MTSAQTMSNHSSFPSKQKPMLLSDQNTHHYPTTKSNPDNEPQSKPSSQRHPRPATATKMSLRTRDHSEKETAREPGGHSDETTRKSDASPQTSSENVLQGKHGLFSNKFAGKWDKVSEEASSEKEGRNSEPPSSRKASTDDTGYNTRKHARASESKMETEEVKTRNGSRKATGDPNVAQQNAGYHLRSSEYKSGNKDSNFSDDYEYEYPGRHMASSEIVGTVLSNSRGKGGKGPGSSNGKGIDGDQEEGVGGAGQGNQRREGVRSSRRNATYTITYNEESTGLQVPAEIPRRRKSVDDSRRTRGRLVDSPAEGTEDVEDVRENLRADEDSESVASSVRSPMAVKGGGRRRGRKCVNKLCLTDTKISFLWAKEKVNGSAICNVCYSAYSIGHYCQFCSQIYLDDGILTYNDDKDWISCDTCGCWNHMQCEAKHGIRNIFALLQKDKKTKYYCPNCRNEKAIKKPKGLSSTQDHEVHGSTTPRNGNNLRRNARNEHQRPPWDDWLVCEEGLEEPPMTKKRVNGGTRGYNNNNNLDVSASGEEDKMEEEDTLKKKLDSLFSRASSRRRALQWKNPPSVLESFGELEKLMSQLAGKKMQLSDQEIKADLAQIKEMFKIPESVHGYSETNVSEVEVAESMEEVGIEKSEGVDSEDEERVGARGRNGRGKVQRRSGARGKSRAVVVQNVTKEEKVVSKSGKGSGNKAGNGNTGARMQLRVRKVN